MNLHRNCQGCGSSSIRARGLCSPCYQRRAKTGEFRRVTLVERLAKRTALDDAGCLIWLGELNNYGYGVLTIRHRNQRAHRVMYEHVVGAIPHGLQLDHLCRNRVCVNPEHLEPVTAAENLRRARTAAAEVSA